MYPERLLHQQAGAGLPVALFIITVLALLVIGMAQLQESSSKAVSLQIQSQRAFFAAESGVQVAVTRVLKGEFCASSVTFSGQGLFGCRVELTGCSSGDGFDYEGETYYRIQSVGVCGEGSVEEATRRVEVMLR